MMTGPFQSPQLDGPPPTPIRNGNMIYPSGDKSFWEKVHIMGDSENDSISDPNKKFLRNGLWYSALCGEGTIISYEGHIYIIPNKDIDNFCDQIMSQGHKAFTKYESFEDPTLPYTDDKGLIQESLSSQKSSEKKKAGCFIATACYGSTEVRQVQLLQRYRDEHLRDSPWGRLFISLYYRLSPSLANYIKSSDVLKGTIRKCLIQPLVFFIEKKYLK